MISNSADTLFIDATYCRCILETSFLAQRTCSVLSWHPHSFSLDWHAFRFGYIPGGVYVHGKEPTRKMQGNMAERKAEGKQKERQTKGKQKDIKARPHAWGPSETPSQWDPEGFSYSATTGLRSPSRVVVGSLLHWILRRHGRSLGTQRARGRGGPSKTPSQGGTRNDCETSCVSPTP